MGIGIPPRVEEILNRLREAGYEAYVVGGCVRDSILGRVPEDWDITTSARPQEVKALFARTIDTGIQHGTVTVMVEGQGFEVTTYRIDGSYEDNRHPREVTFTPSLREDLLRRDFTVNAMAYNPEKGLVDLFGGMEDIRKKVIRCVGDPRARFGEDALRIMRAVRFCAQLGYTIDEKTREAIQDLSGTLEYISAERIQTELIKLLVSDHPECMREAWSMGITAVILPELDLAMDTSQENIHHCYTVGDHIIHSLSRVEPQKELRLAMLLHDLAKPLVKTMDEAGRAHFYGHEEEGAVLAGRIMKRLKMDRATMDKVRRLVRWHDWGKDGAITDKALRRAMNRMGEDLFPQIFQVQRADILAQSDYQRQEKLDRMTEWESRYKQVVEAGECVSLKQLAIKGGDLMELGMRPGKELGDMLERLLDQVLEDPSQNTKEKLEELVRRWRPSSGKEGNLDHGQI